jgi:hypothetical protein
MENHLPYINYKRFAGFAAMHGTGPARTVQKKDSPFWKTSWCWSEIQKRL